MLPTPVAFARRGTFRFRQHPQVTASYLPFNVYGFLLSRARITNLGFFLLLFTAALSLLCNAHLLYSAQHLEQASASALFSTISRDPAIRKLGHLIIVPGHAIWKGTDPELRLREDQWVLEPYQMGGGRISAFFAHILRGAELAGQDVHSLLVFSGGQTRSTTTTTEAESYMRLALAADVFHTNYAPFNRSTTENHALDSYQNLLFSIARFHEYTGRYPTKITVVGYEFKRARFADLHRSALRWPLDNFDYIGVDPSSHHTTVEEDERKNGYVPYSKDLYGCHGVLMSKRRQRNLYSRFHSYYQTSPELRPILDWCPPSDSSGERSTLFTGELPWDV
ncbi:hypothetical protein H0H87_004189 [Tephrocybe sp. NHM501043]|nr:hypothetical protein H0H87_004189 [Tephrocybe sp. NHM501043]